MTRLFIDMDGVLADFDKHYLHVFGESPEDSDAKHKSLLWKNINGHMGEFFAEMPQINGAGMLLNKARLLRFFGNVAEVYFLTAAGDSAFDRVSREKRKWLKEHFGQYDFMMLTTRKGVDKAAFVQDEGDILIDDMEKNCAAWEAAGGIAIRFKNAEQAIAELKEVLNVKNFS